jgi:hypothetical protein
MVDTKIHDATTEMHKMWAPKGSWLVGVLEWIKWPNNKLQVLHDRSGGQQSVSLPMWKGRIQDGAKIFFSHIDVLVIGTLSLVSAL